MSAIYMQLRQDMCYMVACVAACGNADCNKSVRQLAKFCHLAGLVEMAIHGCLLL